MHIVIDGRIHRTSTGRPVDKLMEYLQELDTKNTYSVLIEPKDDWVPKNRKFKAVPCPYPQYSFNPLQQITFARQLYRLKPDLVFFTQTGQQPLFYFGRQITFTHDLTMFKYVRPGRLPMWAHRLRMLGYRVLIWQAHRKAEKIIVPTQYVRDAVAKFHLFTNRKIVVAYEAGDSTFAAESQKPKDVSEDDKYIMYLGSAFPHKNLERLIEAFELLKIKHPDLKLILVGKQEYHSKQLQKWASSQPHYKDIIFTGFIPDGEAKWLYEHALVYVFPSLSEGFGLPALEAMAHGCPVVSSNATCLPEVYGDAAHYFDPEDVEEMAEKIEEVIVNTRLRNKLIENGFVQIKKYSWKRMNEQIIAVINQAF